MSRIHSIFALLLLAASLALAGPADSILARSAQLFSGKQGLSLDFSLRVLQAATGSENQTQGSLLVGERNRFRLRVPGMEFYSDGVQLWQYNPAQKQVMVKLLADLESQFHPSEILFKYQQCKPRSLKSELWQGKKVHVLQLDPSRYKGQFSEMEVWLDPVSLAPVRLKTVDNLHNLSWYTVSNLKKVKASDKDFVFVVPKGVDEIDMR